MHKDRSASLVACYLFVGKHNTRGGVCSLASWLEGIKGSLRSAVGSIQNLGSYKKKTHCEFVKLEYILSKL